MTLHRHPILQLVAGKATRHSGIESDRVDPAFHRIALIEDTRATWKTDDRDHRKSLLQPRGNSLGRLDDPSPEAALGQYPGPAVEQLNDIGARSDLARQIIDSRIDDQSD